MKSRYLKQSLIVMFFTVLIAGCAQVGPKTQKGALIGAGTGGVVSAVTGGNIVKGAVVGSAVGAGIGYLEEH